MVDRPQRPERFEEDEVPAPRVEEGFSKRPVGSRNRKLKGRLRIGVEQDCTAQTSSVRVLAGSLRINARHDAILQANTVRTLSGAMSISLAHSASLQKNVAVHLSSAMSIRASTAALLQTNTIRTLSGQFVISVDPTSSLQAKPVKTLTGALSVRASLAALEQTKTVIHLTGALSIRASCAGAVSPTNFIRNLTSAMTVRVQAAGIEQTKPVRHLTGAMSIRVSQAASAQTNTIRTVTGHPNIRATLAAALLNKPVRHLTGALSIRASMAAIEHTNTVVHIAGARGINVDLTCTAQFKPVRHLTGALSVRASSHAVATTAASIHSSENDQLISLTLAAAAQVINEPATLPPPLYIIPQGSPPLFPWADTFNPVFTGGPVAGAPLLGPIIPQAQPGDTIPLVGSFTSAATFAAYSQSIPEDASESVPDINLIATNRASVRFSDFMTSNTMILVYTVDGGKYSTPAVVNRAETWWLTSHTTGSDSVIVGDMVSIFGRNLSYALDWFGGYDGSNAAEKIMIWLYTPGLAGQNVECFTINPYRATFQMPNTFWPIATSTSSNTFTTGPKAFTTQAGLGYIQGLAVTIWNSTGYLLGTITGYSDITLNVSVTTVESGASGTRTSWVIEITYDISVYCHNGHGGIYGWSRALTMHITNKPKLGINYDKIAAIPVGAPNGTNDTTAFNNAIAFAGSNGPVTLTLQAGTYRVASRIALNGGFNKAFQLKGQGAGSTTIIPTAGFIGASGEIISSNAMSELRDLTIDASAYTAGNVTNATNATPIVITTSAAHGFTTGDYVRIVGVGGNTAANGGWNVTVLTTTTFRLLNGASNSVGNGAYTSGGTWARETSVRVPRIVDCNILIRKPSTIDFPTGGSCYMTGCIIVAPYADALNNTSIFVFLCNFFGTDLADQVFHTGGGRNIFFVQNTAQHFNPSGTNAEKGHGRMFVGELLTYGSQRNIYIAENSTPTRFNNPEGFGDGELFLWDGARCSSSSMATAATSSTVTITDVASASWINTRHAAVTGGRGEGQMRLITGVSGNQLSVDPSWDLTPNTTSRINVVATVNRTVIYNNFVTGGNILNDGSEQGDSQAVNLFTGGSEIIVDGNNIADMHYGYSEWCVGVTAALTEGVVPLYFNLVQNNSFYHCDYGVRTVIDPALDSETALMLGNLRRNNLWGGTVVTGWYIHKAFNAAHVDADVFQGCEFDGEKFGVYLNDTAQAANTVLVDTIFIGNNVSGSIAKRNITLNETGSTDFSNFEA